MGTSGGCDLSANLPACLISNREPGSTSGCVVLSGMCLCRCWFCCCLLWKNSEHQCRSSKVVHCYRAKNSKAASISAVLDTKRTGLTYCRPPAIGAIGLPSGTALLIPTRLAARRTLCCLLLCACTFESTALAPSSALSQRTKNANTRAGGEQAMRLLQALAGQKIVEKERSSSGTGKGLSTGCGYLPEWFSLALLPNRQHALPAFCSREVSFALSLNVSCCRIRKQVRSGAVRSPFTCIRCWRLEKLH